MKKGDVVRWKREDGGGYAEGHVIGVRDGRVQVEYGSGNHTFKKWMRKTDVRVKDPS